MEERPSKRRPSPARVALAENVNYLLRTYNFGVGIEVTEVERQTKGAITAKTLRRMRNPYSATVPNLETIDTVAEFFGLSTPALLTRQPRAEQLAKSKQKV